MWEVRFLGYMKLRKLKAALCSENDEIDKVKMKQHMSSKFNF